MPGIFGEWSSKIDSTQSESAVVMTEDGDLMMTGITPLKPPNNVAVVDSMLGEGTVVAVAPFMMLLLLLRVFEIAAAVAVVSVVEEERKGFEEVVLSDWRSSRRSGCQGSFSRRLMIAISSSSSSNALVEAERRVDRFYIGIIARERGRLWVNTFLLCNTVLRVAVLVGWLAGSLWG
jgi:hypothetical protein